MGHLDAAGFEQLIAGCTRCDAKAFEVATYIDRQQTIRLGSAADDGRWTHDDAKFIDGIYNLRCLACGTEPYASADCPRCHRRDGIVDALGKPARIAVPQRCPSCRGTEVEVAGLAPATVRTGASRPAPRPTALFGQPGFQIAAVTCEGCDWVLVAESCPLCGGPGPLRDRP